MCVRSVVQGSKSLCFTFDAANPSLHIMPVPLDGTLHWLVRGPQGVAMSRKTGLMGRRDEVIIEIKSSVRFSSHRPVAKGFLHK